jgi:hypothetical protein
MRIADACLVRLTEILPNPLLLTIDSDFKIYRRLGRRVEISGSLPQAAVQVIAAHRGRNPQ